MASALPRDVTPMLATAGTLPAKDDGWAYEIKFDGVRVLAFVENGTPRLVTRNGNDVTSSYPEVAEIADDLEGRAAILDGEVVVFDPKGRTDFSLLQSRMHVRAPSEALASRGPGDAAGVRRAPPRRRVADAALLRRAACRPARPRPPGRGLGHAPGRGG